MDLSTLLKNPSFWTVVAVLLLVVYLERKQILALISRRARVREQEIEADQELISRRARVREQEIEADQAFDKQVREYLVTNAEYNKQLMDRILEMLETERQKTAILTSQLMDAVANRVSSEMVDVMRTYAEIADAQANRVGEFIVEIKGVAEEAVRCQSATLVVLNRLYGVRNPEVAAALREITAEDGGEG